MSPGIPCLLAVHPLATTNAILNGLSAVLLVAGWVAIKRGRVHLHRRAMTGAFLLSAVFLACYLAYHAMVGHVPFAGSGAVRGVYLSILASHVVLAAAVPVLALRMLFLASRGRFDAHRRLGRIALPIWLYVSVTGVVIYVMLYHLFPGPEPGREPVAAVLPTLVSVGSGPVEPGVRPTEEAR